MPDKFYRAFSFISRVYAIFSAWLSIDAGKYYILIENFFRTSRLTIDYLAAVRKV